MRSAEVVHLTLHKLVVGGIFWFFRGILSRAVAVTLFLLAASPADSRLPACAGCLRLQLPHMVAKFARRNV